jgi:hypothetical protein
MATSAVDIAVVMFQSLPDDEQEDLYQRLAGLRARRPAGRRDRAVIISLRLVADHVAGSPSDGLQARLPRLRDDGVEVQEFNRVVRHFGFWRLAKEALSDRARFAATEEEVAARQPVVAELSVLPPLQAQRKQMGHELAEQLQNFPGLEDVAAQLMGPPEPEEDEAPRSDA